MPDQRDPKQPADPRNPELEGEGSHSADEAYRAGVAKHIQQGRVEEEAEQARRAVEEDPEGFRRAEEEAKRHSAGDLPEDEEHI
jgi:hypothetical protein